MRIAITGAGVSGLSCADALSGFGYTVSLFDKGRGPGGRMSTRRVEAAGQTLRFDHGAQYFTVRDAAFAAQVSEWHDFGVAAPWPEVGVDAWVGTPGMNAPVKAMAARLPVSWGVRIDGLDRRDGHWRLVGAAESDSFEAVVVAVPAEQAVPLLQPFEASFAARAARARSAPCWTVMVLFPERLATDRTIIRDSGAIGWAARDASKPGREEAETWVVQASPDWSTQHLEAPAAQVARELLALLEAVIGRPLPTPLHLSAHRWRYARSGDAGAPGALWDAGRKLGACGDWLLGPRVEAAWLSGRYLARMIEPGLSV